MRLRLRQCLAMLGMLVTGACADSPTAPTISPDDMHPSKIGAYIPPDDGGGCDKYTDPNFCQGRRTGECITSTPGMVDSEVSVESCGGAGGGGGTAPPSDPAPDSCLTGDEALDAPAVKQGLKDLWTRSNPDAPQSQRLEQAGWIVRGWDGSYSMVPFNASVQGPCEINGNLAAPPGAVAFVHTHPFTKGEAMMSCGPIKMRDPSAPGGYREMVGPNGEPLYDVYRNNPSDSDRQVLDQVNSMRADLTPPQDQLAGVIIDANQTTVYTESSSEKPTPLPRCF